MQNDTAGAGGGCVWWSWGGVLCLIETSKHVLGLPLRGIMHHASRLPVGESFDSPSSLVRHHSVSNHASNILRRPDIPRGSDTAGAAEHIAEWVRKTEQKQAQVAPVLARGREPNGDRWRAQHQTGAPTSPPFKRLPCEAPAQKRKAAPSERPNIHNRHQKHCPHRGEGPHSKRTLK
jgi:hypothetical protein